MKLVECGHTSDNMSILLQVGVKIFLEDKVGRFLLLKRSQVKYPAIRNFWDIPGGRIIPGTNLFDNLKREVFEETKLEIFGKPRLLSAQDIIRGKEKHIVRLTYTGKVSSEPAQVRCGRICSGEPILNEEHIDFKWLTISEMRKVKELDEFTREVIEKYF